MSTAIRPNRYDLRSRMVSVTYGEAGADGEPYVNYTNSEQSLSLSFKGDQIRAIQTDLGKTVSVSLRMTVDSGSTSFTILVPRALIPKGQPSIPIKTIGITTVHKFSVLPALNTGQDDLYSTEALSGTASFESRP